MVRHPLVVTVRMPAALFACLDALRRAHFPPGRNHVPAHVTLFHALPPSAEDETRRLLARAAATRAPPEAFLRGLSDFGTGTAVAIHSPALDALHAELAETFHGLLTAQDAARPRFHVTIQNKAPRPEARALQTALAGRFLDERFRFAGLDLHRYQPLPGGGGTWQALAGWTFRGR